MPVEMGSFDVIIGMDWLAKYHDVIVCDEKLVRVPFGDKTLIFHGDGSNNGHESRLNIISCTKTQKYLLEGCPIFLAQVTMKKAEDKSKEKQLEEVPIVQDFPEPSIALVLGLPHRISKVVYEVGEGEGELVRVLGRPNKVLEWVLCVQWLRLAVTGARIGSSKSSQSLSIAHKWAVVID
ncbi:hypothetical protein Tco_1360382 [Tanacetum coccineum]